MQIHEPGFVCDGGPNVGVYDLKLYTSHCLSCFVANFLVYAYMTDHGDWLTCDLGHSISHQMLSGFTFKVKVKEGSRHFY